MNEATLTGIAVKNTLPLTALRPSQTHVQAVRRARYNQDSLRELAESIRASGILQPILVRPVESMIHDGGRKSSAEIVAGERRWRAAELAGLTEVPIIIRHLTDSQVLEAQLVENLQREDLDALSEAEGYRELMECAQISADALADKIGKSRSYVYARVKLLGLCEEGRTAMASGKLDASRALLVARIRDSKDQAKALQLALDMDWRGENPRLSYRELVKEIGKKHATMSLVGAPFDPADATLAPGACTGCEYRTGNCVVAGVQESPDVCTDVKCWKAKERAANERRLDNARALLLPIITGEDAARILKNGGDIAGYVNLDAVCDDDRFLEAEPAKTGDEAADNAAKDAWDVRWAEHEPRTYREILGPDANPTAVIVDPKTKRAAELMPVANVRDALKKHGIELSNWVGATPPPISKSDPAEERLRGQVAEDKRKKEHAFRLRLAKEILPKALGPLTHAELVKLAEEQMEEHYHGKAILAQIYGARPVPSTMKADSLGRLLRILPVLHDIHYTDNGGTNLFALAKSVKVDAKAVRGAMEAEEKGQASPPKTSAPARAKKLAKKAVKTAVAKKANAKAAKK